MENTAHMRDGMKQRDHRKRHYKRYDLVVDRDTLLMALLERYKERHPPERQGLLRGERYGGLSELIRLCLCDYFDIEPDEIYASAYTNSRGEQRLASHDLDTILNEARANAHHSWY